MHRIRLGHYATEVQHCDMTQQWKAYLLYGDPLEKCDILTLLELDLFRQ